MAKDARGMAGDGGSSKRAGARRAAEEPARGRSGGVDAYGLSVHGYLALTARYVLLRRSLGGDAGVVAVIKVSLMGVEDARWGGAGT